MHTHQPNESYYSQSHFSSHNQDIGPSSHAVSLFLTSHVISEHGVKVSVTLTEHALDNHGHPYKGTFPSNCIATTCTHRSIVHASDKRCSKNDTDLLTYSLLSLFLHLFYFLQVQKEGYLTKRGGRIKVTPSPPPPHSTHHCTPQPPTCTLLLPHFTVLFTPSPSSLSPPLTPPRPAMHSVPYALFLKSLFLATPSSLGRPDGLCSVMEKFVILTLPRQALLSSLSNLIIWIVVVLAQQSKLPIKTLTLDQLVDVYPCTVNDRDCVFRYCCVCVCVWCGVVWCVSVCVSLCVCCVCVVFSYLDVLLIHW